MDSLNGAKKKMKLIIFNVRDTRDRGLLITRYAFATLL